VAALFGLFVGETVFGLIRVDEFGSADHAVEGVLLLVAWFASRTVPAPVWQPPGEVDHLAGARNGARSPTDSSRSQPISISRKPLEIVPHVVQRASGSAHNRTVLVGTRRSRRRPHRRRLLNPKTRVARTPIWLCEFARRIGRLWRPGEGRKPTIASCDD
jgi:hypothetical protein